MDKDMVKIEVPVTVLGASGSPKSDTIKEGRFLYDRKTGKIYFDDLNKRVLLNPNADWDSDSGNSQILNKPDNAGQIPEELYNKLNNLDIQYDSNEKTLKFSL